MDTRVPLAKLQPLTKVAEIISPKRKRRHHHHGVSSVDIKPVIPLVTAEPSEFQMVVVGSSDILEPVAIPVALPLALEATIEGTIEGTIELKTTSEGTINATIEGDLPTNQPIVLNLDTRSLLEVYNQVSFQLFFFLLISSALAVLHINILSSPARAKSQMSANQAQPLLFKES